MEKILWGWFAPSISYSWGKLNNTVSKSWNRRLEALTLGITNSQITILRLLYNEKERNIHKDGGTLFEYQVLCEISYLAFWTLLKDTSVSFILFSSVRAERGQLSLKRWISVSCNILFVQLGEGVRKISLRHTMWSIQLPSKNWFLK